jgi:hypothetical protein
MKSVARSYYQRLRDVWHAQRAELFLDLVQPPRGALVLDLGGGNGEFMSRLLRTADIEVTIADLPGSELHLARARNMKTVELAEGESLPFASGAFDVVFCNSVIEHVTVPKADCMTKRFSNKEWTKRSRENQRRFALEVRRVGRSYFVQTPHRAFPIESHTWLPLAGWMPHNTVVNVVRLSDKFWVKRCGYVDWSLLGPRDMRTFFPDGKLHVERVWGLPKSLIAYARHPHAQD